MPRGSESVASKDVTTAEAMVCWFRRQGNVSGNVNPEAKWKIRWGKHPIVAW